MLLAAEGSKGPEQVGMSLQVATVANPKLPQNRETGPLIQSPEARLTGAGLFTSGQRQAPVERKPLTAVSA